MRTKLTKALCLSLIVCILLSVFMVTVSAATVKKEVVTDFSKTNVLDDLESSTVNGQLFDITDYPYSEQLDIKLITMVEYCYSFESDNLDHYGLYLYIYNPRNLTIDTSSGANKIQMATAYDSKGVPTRYDKFNLQFCNTVESGNYKNLFYKFKVVEKEINGTTFYDRVNSNARRYDITGIELKTKGDTNATEYFVGGTYIFSGYAKGFGPDKEADSNLNCVVEELETLKLSVHHTNYRTGVSDKGEDYYNEVNTVYFSVPERVFEQYGNLQKIRAEWWEYKTKMATITSNQDFYNQLLQYVGTDVGQYSSSVPVKIYSGYDGRASTGPGIPTYHDYHWVYNVNLDTQYTSLGTIFSVSQTDKQSTIMPYAFYAPVTDVGGVFDFLSSDPVAGSVSSSVVRDWIYNYSNNLGHGYVDCNGRQLSKDLFEDSVDSGRTMGYNDKTIDMGDTFDLLSYDSNHSWWDKLWDYGFSWPTTDEQHKGVKPIHILEAGDLIGTNATISQRLLVKEDDVAALKAFYNTETANGNRVVIFRFASTEYYCAPAFTSAGSNMVNCDTYVAQQTVFFDFDIIELTFNNDGAYRVIPVVSSPIDIVNEFQPPPEEELFGNTSAFWMIVIAIIMLVIIIIIGQPALNLLVQLLIWIVMLPVRLVQAIIDLITGGGDIPPDV